MVAKYVKYINKGKMTLDDVAPMWKDAVIAELEKEKREKQNTIQ